MGGGGALLAKKDRAGVYRPRAAGPASWALPKEAPGFGIEGRLVLFLVPIDFQRLALQVWEVLALGPWLEGGARSVHL